jgi:ABC-type molybdenum transport system ATPase subunit/photorepair protein PhrA
VIYKCGRVERDGFLLVNLTQFNVHLQIKALKALRDVAIDGEKVVLYGPNGAGKSTIHVAPRAPGNGSFAR